MLVPPQLRAWVIPRTSVPCILSKVYSTTQCMEIFDAQGIHCCNGDTPNIPLLNESQNF